MAKHIKITQSDLVKIVESVLKEMDPSATGGGDSPQTVKFNSLTKDDILAIQIAIKNEKEFASLLGNSGPNKDGVDGILGSKTLDALSKFQKKYKLTQIPGSMDELTFNKLLSFFKPEDMNLFKKPTAAKSSASAPAAKKNSFLFFDGKSLKLVVNGSAVATYNAWSGRTKWNATTPAQKDLVNRMVNKVDFMKIKGAGPIPEGAYYLGGIQKRTNGDALKFAGNKDWYELLKIYDAEYSKIGDNHNFNAGTAQDMIAWGNYRMAIIPKGGTETYGRGSFYLHGGGLAGSIGCIDLVDRIDDFVSI